MPLGETAAASTNRPKEGKTESTKKGCPQKVRKQSPVTCLSKALARPQQRPVVVEAKRKPRKKSSEAQALPLPLSIPFPLSLARCHLIRTPIQVVFAALVASRLFSRPCPLSRRGNRHHHQRRRLLAHQQQVHQQHHHHVHQHQAPHCAINC